VEKTPSLTSFPKKGGEHILELELSSFLLGQSASIYLNGELLQKLALKRNKIHPLRLTTQLIAGKNRIELSLDKSGYWKDLLEVYSAQNGILAFFKIRQLKMFYQRHRHQAVVIRKFSLSN